MSAVADHAMRCQNFLELHVPGRPLLMPNPWDAGSARLLAGLGFGALATTSSGFAATLGRLDGRVSQEEAIGHAAAIVSATHLPVSADLENGFGDRPEDVAETAARAVGAALAGFSIEDFTGDEGRPIYEPELAAERIAAAAGAAHAGDAHVVLTARCENFLHGLKDLDDTIDRLNRYAAAGADVLYAPGLSTSAQIEAVLSNIELPLNVLARPGVPPVSELGALGVSRISVGGAFAFAGLGAVVEAAEELRDQGTYGYAGRAASGVRAAQQTFSEASQPPE